MPDSDDIEYNDDYLPDYVVAPIDEAMQEWNIPTNLTTREKPIEGYQSVLKRFEDPPVLQRSCLGWLRSMGTTIQKKAKNDWSPGWSPGISVVQTGLIAVPKPGPVQAGSGNGIA